MLEQKVGHILTWYTILAGFDSVCGHRNLAVFLLCPASHRTLVCYYMPMNINHVFLLLSRISPRSTDPVLTLLDTLLALSLLPSLLVVALSNCLMPLVSLLPCPSSSRPTVPLTSPKLSLLRLSATTGTCVPVRLSRNLTCSSPFTKRLPPMVTLVVPNSPGNNPSLLSSKSL